MIERIFGELPGACRVRVPYKQCYLRSLVFRLAVAGFCAQGQLMARRPRPLASKVINPLRESRSIEESYCNRRLAAANDHEIRMSVMTSGFEWHSHPNSDEIFFVIEGELVIELQDQQVRLGAGDLFTVPKGVVHRTRPVAHVRST